MCRLYNTKANGNQTTISDLVQISPEDFQKPSLESIQDNINAKYANKVFHLVSEYRISNLPSTCRQTNSGSKVIPKIGLCIHLYDILHVADGIIGHGTGIANVNVEFRLIVFRPFKGEIILGQISSASEHGIKSIPFILFLNCASNLVYFSPFVQRKEEEEKKTLTCPQSTSCLAHTS